MHIELLADCAELLPLIARWHWGEWGHHNPQGSYERTLDRLSRRANRDRIPLTYIALEGDDPIGTASLVEHDMESRKDLSPWLAGVYVDPAYRRQGVASALVRKVCEAAESLGVQTLYLYTNTAAILYQQLGWEPMMEQEYRGKRVQIMKYEF